MARLIDIRGHRFGPAARIDALDEIAARLDGFDRRAIGGRRIRPCDPIAAHDALLAPRQGAVQRDPVRLHQDASAVACEHDPDPPMAPFGLSALLPCRF